MDVICFNNPSDPSLLQNGRIINGLKSKMWVERFRDAGEFTFVADVKTGMREKLPIGSLVSHVNTPEVMIVENHEINQTGDKDSEITVTGRGYETWLENRVVGGNDNFPTWGATNTNEYDLFPIDTIYNQIVKLIRDHVGPSAGIVNGYDVLPHLYTTSSGITGTWATAKRSVAFGTVYERVLELLKSANFGIKTIRPGPWSPAPNPLSDTTFQIHLGIDRSATVMFSQDTGEIENAAYLWSNKPLKTTAIVVGKWTRIRIDDSPLASDNEGYNRRMIFVQASDIDERFSATPTGADWTASVASMTERGRQALNAQREVAITKAEIAKNRAKARIRVDYNVGDIISVNGSYNSSSKMRVSEYVEIEDQTGETSYPTLELL